MDGLLPQLQNLNQEDQELYSRVTLCPTVTLKRNRSNNLDWQKDSTVTSYSRVFNIILHFQLSLTHNPSSFKEHGNMIVLFKLSQSQSLCDMAVLMILQQKP